MGYFITLLLNVQETWFWCPTPGLWEKEIIWDHFQKPQNMEQIRSCGPRTGSRGGRRARTTTYKGWNSNLGTEHATDLVLVSNPMRPFSWCSMMLRSTWWSRTGCTGCRRSRATLRCKISLLWCQLCPHILNIRNYVGSLPRPSDQHEWQEHDGGAVEGREWLPGFLDWNR